MRSLQLLTLVLLVTAARAEVLYTLTYSIAVSNTEFSVSATAADFLGVGSSIQLTEFSGNPFFYLPGDSRNNGLPFDTPEDQTSCLTDGKPCSSFFLKFGQSQSGTGMDVSFADLYLYGELGYHVAGIGARPFENVGEGQVGMFTNPNPDTLDYYTSNEFFIQTLSRNLLK